MNIGVQLSDVLPPTYEQWQEVMDREAVRDTQRYEHLKAFNDSDYLPDRAGIIQYCFKNKVEFFIYNYLMDKIIGVENVPARKSYNSGRCFVSH